MQKKHCDQLNAPKLLISWKKKQSWGHPVCNGENSWDDKVQKSQLGIVTVIIFLSLWRWQLRLFPTCALLTFLWSMVSRVKDSSFSSCWWNPSEVAYSGNSRIFHSQNASVTCRNSSSCTPSGSTTLECTTRRHVFLCFLSGAVATGGPDGDMYASAYTEGARHRGLVTRGLTQGACDSQSHGCWDNMDNLVLF